MPAGQSGEADSSFVSLGPAHPDQVGFVASGGDDAGFAIAGVSGDRLGPPERPRYLYEKLVPERRVVGHMVWFPLVVRVV